MSYCVSKPAPGMKITALCISAITQGEPPFGLDM
jgi:hypothetical protein